MVTCTLMFMSFNDYLFSFMFDGHNYYNFQLFKRLINRFSKCILTGVGLLLILCNLIVTLKLVAKKGLAIIHLSLFIKNIMTWLASSFQVVGTIVIRLPLFQFF
jgi:hypothetical protein